MKRKDWRKNKERSIDYRMYELSILMEIENYMDNGMSEINLDFALNKYNIPARALWSISKTWIFWKTNINWKIGRVVHAQSLSERIIELGGKPPQPDEAILMGGVFSQAFDPTLRS